jgi:hypothetical protein
MANVDPKTCLVRTAASIRMVEIRYRKRLAEERRLKAQKQHPFKGLAALIGQ